MKTYNNPTIEVVELRIDEIILASDVVKFSDLVGGANDSFKGFGWDN